MKLFAGIGLVASKEQREKDQVKVMAEAQMMLQLAQKELEIQEIRNENALIMLEIAMITRDSND